MFNLTISDMINQRINLDGAVSKAMEINPKSNITMYEELLVGMHERNIGRDFVMDINNQESDYITVNIFGTVSRVFQSFLFGETPIFSIECQDENERKKLEEQLTDLIKKNNLHKKNSKQSLYQSALGGCFYKLRWGKRYSVSIKNELIIEAVHPIHVETLLNEYDKSVAEGFSIDTVITLGRNKDKFIKREIFTSGKQENQIYALEGDKVGKRLPWNMFNELQDVAEITDISEYTDSVFVVYIPNDIQLPTAFYGLSDYYDILTLGKDFNKRYSYNSKILDSEQDPRWIMPIEAADNDPYNPTGGATIRKDKILLVGDGIKKDDYGAITTGADIEESERHINLLYNALTLTTGIDKATLGISDKTDGQGLSGAAIRQQKQQLLKRVQNKRLNFDDGLKELLKTAITMERVFGDGYSMNVPDFEVNIKWFDGIPVDPTEEANYQSTLLDSGLTTKKEAVKQIHDVTDEKADQMIKEIEKENNVVLQNKISTMAQNMDFSN